MNDESIDVEVIEQIDPPSALALSEGLTFRYSVFIANLRSRILGALFILAALVGAVCGVVLLYFLPSDSKLSAVALPFFPALLVILIFAGAATVRYVLSLNVVSHEARAALALQLDAQQRARTAWSGAAKK